MSDYFDRLNDEIEFWRDLIGQSELNSTSPEYIRMQQALQLAKARLTDCELELLNNVDCLAKH